MKTLNTIKNVITGLFGLGIIVVTLIFFVKALKGDYDKAAYEFDPNNTTITEMGEILVYGDKKENLTDNAQVVETSNTSAPVEKAVAINSYIVYDPDGYLEEQKYSLNEMKEIFAETYTVLDEYPDIQIHSISKNEYVAEAIRLMNEAGIVENGILKCTYNDFVSISGYVTAKYTLPEEEIAKLIEAEEASKTAESEPEEYADSMEARYYAEQAYYQDLINEGNIGCGYIDSSDGFMNLRSGPGTENSIIMELENGVYIEAYEMQFGSDGNFWYYIIVFNNDTGEMQGGWVSGSGVYFYTEAELEWIANNAG